MLSSITTALQNVAAQPTDSKPCRISDLIPRCWAGSNEKGKFCCFMSGLHLWMQAWSNEGERILTSVEKLDKFDNNTIAVNCSDEEFPID